MLSACSNKHALLRLMMGQNMPPVKDDGYLLMNSITEASQHHILKSLVQIHFTIRTETKIINYSVFHKRYPFFLALHTETLLMCQLPVALGGKDILACKETTRTWFIFTWTATRCTQLCGENFHRSQLLYPMLFFTANFYNDFSQGSKPQ